MLNMILENPGESATAAFAVLGAVLFILTSLRAPLQATADMLTAKAATTPSTQDDKLASGFSKGVSYLGIALDFVARVMPVIAQNGSVAR